MKVWAQLRALFSGAVVMISGCMHHRVAAPAPVASPHYFLGAAYQADGHWYYPAETYSLNVTGIASIEPGKSGLTADGEAPNPAVATGAMQTVQLPVIVTVTNLDNGRQIELRVNDRGPASPGRIIAVSPRAAILLAMPASGAARVRVTIDEMPSRNLVDQLGGGPRLQIATAPSTTIMAESLAAPGTGLSGPVRTIGAPVSDDAGPRVPDRLPERIVMTYATPGDLYLNCGSFGRFTYANEIAAKLSGLGANVVRSRDGRQTAYAVRAGPFASVFQADMALDQALRAGVIDARISVE